MVTTYSENANLVEKTEVNDQQAGKFLRKAREEKGLTRDQLAEKIGRHRNSIYNLEENGQASPELWALVAEVLGYEHHQPHVFIPKD